VCSNADPETLPFLDRWCDTEKWYSTRLGLHATILTAHQACQLPMVHHGPWATVFPEALHSGLQPTASPCGRNGWRRRVEGAHQ